MKAWRNPPPLRAASAVAGMLLLGATGCHDKPDEPNPCQTQVANPLRMEFIEAFNTPTPDTAYNNQPVTLRAPGAPYTSYQWLIGQIDQRTGQQVVVSFDQSTLGAIPVRLIAMRPRNTACFPKDDGVDTLTKVLTLVPFRDQRAPIYGKFQGADKGSPRDTFSVRIYAGPNFYYPNNPAAEFTNYVVGIPKGCNYPYHDVGITWRGLSASGGSGCSSLDISRAYLTTRDSIRIEYRASPTIIDKVFLGKRIR